MFFKKSRLHIFAALGLLVSSCNFISDNQDPHAVLKIAGQASAGPDCANLKDAWKRFDKDTERGLDEASRKASDDTLSDVVLCQLDALQKKFDSIKMPRAEGFYPDEFAALAKPFFLKDRPLNKEEASSLFLMKSLITGRSEATWHKDEIKIVYNYLKTHPRVISELRWNRFRALLQVVRDHDRFDKEISLGPDALAGFTFFVERFSDDRFNLSSLRSRLAELPAAFNPFLGYSSSMKKIPLRSFLNAVPEFIRHQDRVRELSSSADGTFSFEEFAAISPERIAAMHSEIADLAHALVQASGFGKGATLQAGDWARLLKVVDQIGWDDKETGHHSLSFGLPADRMAAIFQKASATYAGRAESSRLQAADIEAAIEAGMAPTFEQRLTQFVTMRPDDRSKIARLGFSPSSVQLFQHLEPLIETWYDYPDHSASINFGKFYLLRHKISIFRALLSGFDDDQDGLLDLSRGLDDNEFRELLRTSDKVLFAIDKLSPATAKQGRRPGDEDRETPAPVNVKGKDVEELLSSKKSSLVLSTFADNMALASKGDGKINAVELYLLVQELQGIKRAQALQKEIVDSGHPEYASLFALISREDTARDIRFALLGSKIPAYYGYLDVSEKPVDANDRAYVLETFGAARDAAEAETKLNLKRAHLYDGLARNFSVYKPWLVAVQEIIPVGKVLSDDELTLASLLSTWVENILVTHGPILCADPLDKVLKADACFAPLSREEFETTARAHLGPSSLRMLPLRLRAPLLAAGITPEKFFTRALWKSPELLQTIRTRGTDTEAVAKLVSADAPDAEPKLGYLELLRHAWALALVMTELGQN